MRRTLTLVILILIGAIVATDLHAAVEHPFLICKRSQFSELRQRAEREPWASMKVDALAVIGKEVDVNSRAGLHRYVGACALAYILDEDKSAEYAARVRDGIAMLDQMDFDPAKAWAGTVPPMGAAFVCILALDIVHDDLSPQDVRACEEIIEKKIGLIDRTGSWPSARSGTHGTWDIYKGIRTTPDEAYYDYCMYQMTDDGVSAVSPGYAFSRMGATDDRPQKSGYADVLEFTGIDRRYYGNERLTKFYRWLFSACVTPAKEFYLFGDASPRWKTPNSLLMWRVGRFDRQAAAYAAWLLKDQKPGGHILSYILMTEPLPAPVVPRSQLFMNGAAVFREKADSPLALGGMLYNIASNAEWHTHEEANAISLSAYGARLLVNGGWLGEPMRPADRNNTIDLNGQGHAERIGGGLIEGLIGDGFDYACGDSGKALGEKAFRRSLLLVHGQEGAGGYFAVIDEVGAAADDTVHAYLQVATESPITETAARREYQAKIDHHARVDGVALSIFYAAAPTSVAQTFIESGSPQRDAASGKHCRLEAVYPTDDDGKRRTVTVLFAHDAKHPKAAMSPIAHKGVTGAVVDLGAGVQDCILASDSAADVEVDGLRFGAKAVMVRRVGGKPQFYFARLGTKLLIGDIGFESSAPISLHMNGKSGYVTSDGAEVTFHHRSVASARIDGQPAKVVATGDGWVRVVVPAGRHEISLH